MIERPDVKLAKDTDLLGAVRIGFDEAFTALRESFYDLDDDRVRAFPIPGRQNVAWTVMHSLLNLDIHGALLYLAHEGTGDRTTYAVDWPRFGGAWDMDARPKPGDPFPSVKEMLADLDRVQRRTTEILGRISGDDLTRPVKKWQCAADACMRTIWHTMAHVRQVWLIRGALGLTDGTAWPQQHWA